MSETSAAHDSKSNGFVERAIPIVNGQLRALKAALEDRVRNKISLDAPHLAKVGGARGDVAQYV